MSKDKPSSKLIRIGAWVQIPFSILMLSIGAWLFWLLYPNFLDPIFLASWGWVAIAILWFVIICGIIGFILSILWFRWQTDIPEHKNGFIASGIIGMIFTGTAPGLLVIIGSILHTSEEL
ncbi:MAG: hypothetical protein ACFFD8_09425 [Candidatus Thorarchaeota archaeon]